jgi:hypothetical protein
LRSAYLSRRRASPLCAVSCEYDNAICPFDIIKVVKSDPHCEYSVHSSSKVDKLRAHE